MSTPIVELEDVVKRYRQVRAVDGVSLAFEASRTTGIVGESGCGKSTIARLTLGLERPSAGTVRFRGRPFGRSASSLKPLRRSVAMIFQDPYESLDPRFRIGEVVAEPLRAHGLLRRGAAGDARIGALLTAVGLAGLAPDGYPGELSGGQRQRLGIARALALDPELLVCDEPTSALDVSVQAQILNLLLDLQRDLGIGLVMISHDLHIVRRMADEIVVMYAGAVMERGPAPVVASRPRHPYTRALLDAIPGASPDDRRLTSTGREGGAGIATAATSGCPFSTRCPLVTDRCRAERPQLPADAHAVACHHPAY